MERNRTVRIRDDWHKRKAFVLRVKDNLGCLIHLLTMFKNSELLVVFMNIFVANTSLQY